MGDEGEDLRPGDVGVVVHVHRYGDAYVVDLLTLEGDPDTVATVLPSQARAVTGKDITHGRPEEIPA